MIQFFFFSSVRWVVLILFLIFQAREIESGVPLNEDSATATAEVSVTIRDVNDEPPTFNKLEYYVSIPENLPEGSPLPNLDMTVTDPDVVSIEWNIKNFS